MKSNRQLIEEENQESNIEFLSGLTDNKLEEKLDVIHDLMIIAESKRNTESLELLELWRYQIIAARIYKAENNIPDAPNEIELAIADIETTVAKAEERDQELGEDKINQRQVRSKIKEDNSDQMSLF